MKAAAACLGCLALLTTLTGLAYLYMRFQVRHTYAVREHVEEWTVAVLDAELGARSYASTGDRGLVASFEQSLVREREKSASVASLVLDNPAQIREVAEADLRAQDAIARLREDVDLTTQGRREEAIRRIDTGEARRLVSVFTSSARRVSAEEEKLLSRRREVAGTLGLWVLGGSLLLSALSVGVLVLARRAQRRRVELLDRIAEDAHRRLHALSDITSSLVEARTSSQVAAVVVERGMAAAGADTCVLHLMNEAGTTLELAAQRGISPDLLDSLRAFTATTGNPRAFEAVMSGTSMWAETAAEYAAAFPAFAKAKAGGPRAKAFWMIPLVVEGRAIGLLAMGYYDERSFAKEERAFFETFAKQCAQALVRASHMQGEDEARRWFETTLGSIGDAVIATDREGRVSFLNAVAERMTGWTRDEAQSLPLDEVFRIFSEKTGAPAENPVAKVLAEGNVVGLANHTVLRSRGGDELPIDDSAAPIRDRDGRLFGVVLVFRDVSEEKRAQARRDFLAQSGEALASSLDYRTTLATVARLAVPELADWCSINILEEGSAAPELLAVAHVDPAKVAFARELSERYPPDPNAKTGVPEVLRTGKPELYLELTPAMVEAGARDAEHLRLIRELKLASAMVVPLRARGRVAGAMTFVYADSGRRYSEGELAFAEDFGRHASLAIERSLAVRELQDAQAREGQLRREAELANRAKDEFLATVSHELRNPLNAILGWAVTLRERTLPSDIERPLGIIERNARAQAKLIEDVLDVSRIISGKLALNIGPTDVADALRAAIETVTPAADAKGIEMKVEIERSLPRIAGDVDRLQQVVWNLLTNALKFTPKGGVVRVGLRRAGSNVCVTVIDSGEGIRPDVLPLVFERFQQADASTTRRHGGLGLGLAIVKNIVAAHGGTVTAASDGPGKGATFVVSLPVTGARTPAVARSAAAAKPVVARLTGLRVLVVDDEPDARALVQAVLELHGATVHAAGSAAEALAKLAADPLDVLVSDVGMPSVDGYMMLRRIRALSPTLGGQIPAVAVTAYARAEDTREALAAGFQAHLAKPIEPDELVSVVAKLAGRLDQPSP